MDSYLSYRIWAHDAADYVWEFREVGPYEEFKKFIEGGLPQAAYLAPTKAAWSSILSDLKRSQAPPEYLGVYGAPRCRTIGSALQESNLRKLQIEWPAPDRCQFDLPLIGQIRFPHARPFLDFAFSFSTWAEYRESTICPREFADAFGREAWHDRHRMAASWRNVAEDILRKLLVTALTNQNPRVRAGIWLYSHHYLNACPSLADLLEYSLEDPDSRVVQTALMALTWSRPQLLAACLDTVLTLVRHPERAVRSQAVRTLAEYLDFDDKRVRRAAAWSLNDDEFMVIDSAELAVAALHSRDKSLISAIRTRFSDGWVHRTGAYLAESPDPVVRDEKEISSYLRDELRKLQAQPSPTAPWGRSEDEALTRAYLFIELCKATNVAPFGPESEVLRALAEKIEQSAICSNGVFITQTEWTHDQILRSIRRRTGRRIAASVRQDIVRDVVADLQIAETEDPLLGINMLQMSRTLKQLGNKIGTFARRIVRDLYLPEPRFVTGGYKVGSESSDTNHDWPHDLPDKQIGSRPVDQVLAERELLALIHAICDRELESQDYTIFRLWSEDLSNVEIGRLLDMPEATVRYRVKRSVSMVQRRLSSMTDAHLCFPLRSTKSRNSTSTIALR